MTFKKLNNLQYHRTTDLYIILFQTMYIILQILQQEYIRKIV